MGAPVSPRKASLMNIPNSLTAMRFLLSAVFVYAFLQHTLVWLYATLACAIVALFSDLFDGYFARRHGTGSDLGKVFDPLADAFFFVTVFLTFAMTGMMPLWMALPFVVRELAQHLYVRPMAMSLGVAMGAKNIGKIKTGVQCYAAILGVTVEIVRGHGDLLVRWFYLEKLFLVLDWWLWISVVLTAVISVYSIWPYLRALAEMQRAQQSAVPTPPNPTSSA